MIYHRDGAQGGEDVGGPHDDKPRDGWHPCLCPQGRSLMRLMMLILGTERL